MSHERLHLKCGIEIHQQLEGRKLFSAAPTIITEDNTYDFEIKRYLRAAAGESGKVDVAAKQEQQKQKVYTYRGKHETSSLVETDSEPPHEINYNALYASLQFSKIVGANVTPVIQVMRKTVVDGSNTSGFQRTALVSRGGYITTSAGEVRIENISLEEDSCRTISEFSDGKLYHLDRLGIPLIEIGTAPDITTPQQAKETARILGNYLRSLPNCKRGLGTIRQDVNVSIQGGERVEIKGAQDLKQVPLLIELEMKRQEELLKLQKDLKGKKPNKLEIADLSEVFSKSTSKRICDNKKKGGVVLAIKIKWFRGVLSRELQPNYRVGTELAGRAIVAAGVGGIFHSDELPNYGISQREVNAASKFLGCSTTDAFILVAAPYSKAQRALEAVHQRIMELYKGVPKEVRCAHPDGTTRFLRLMPGAARMYPETDVPLIITKEVGLIEIPELLDDKINRFIRDYRLAKDLATFVAKSRNTQLFEDLTKEYETIKPAFIAETLGPTLLEIKRKYDAPVMNLTNDDFHTLFKHLSEDTIHKDIIIDVLQDLCRGTFNIKKYASLGTEEIHKVIARIVSANQNTPFPALMGMCMNELAGKASGKFISTELRRIMQKGHM